MSDTKRKDVETCLATGQIARAVEIRTGNIHDLDDYVVLRVLLACGQEVSNGWSQPLIGVFKTEIDLIALFMRVKLLLRRVEFRAGEAAIGEMVSVMEEAWVSPYLVFDILHTNFVDEGQIHQKLWEALSRYGTDAAYLEEFRVHAGKVVLYDIDV